MSILEKLNAIKDTVPHYWPIGAFIHHNPLKGFENLNFKEALIKAQSTFGGKVYMDPDYYIALYNEGKIKSVQLEKNLLRPLKEAKLENHAEHAKTFMLEISPLWNSYRSYEDLKINEIDEVLHTYLEENSIYMNNEVWIESLTRHMTLYEIHDALFGTSKKELIEKDVIEYIARFLDQQQTTLSMTDRDLGMFNTFKLYEDIDYIIDVDAYVQEALEKLKVPDVEKYFLTHILKLHGWAGYIKYRSEAKEYFAQQEHPSTLMDYMAIRLHFEVKYMQKKEVNDFDKLNTYIQNNTPYAILKLLQAKGKLTGTYNDAMEEHKDYQEILDAYVKDEINLNSLQVQLAKKELPLLDMTLIEFSNFANLLKKEEGFIWLKSLEDTYIAQHVDEFTTPHTYNEKPLSSTIFCLDVRSEVIRRKVEESGPYNTYGAGGFLGIPISFVEFDKAHTLALAPAIVKPQNIVFEIPVESHENYNSKKGINKTTKKVLNDLKNNPYTPYIMVEAIGWLFGIKLFGKTFFPEKTQKLFYGFKAKKPKTTYTLNKLTSDEIEKYVKRLHTNIINEVLTTQFDTGLNSAEIVILWEYLVFDKELSIKISPDIINKLKQAYHITGEDYEVQKEKLAQVGFTIDEQLMYIENLLKMLGLVKDFPKFITISGHGSISDNNPFESALDCGACGGNISLPNARAICMIANKQEIREKLREKGIDIPEDTRFLPAMHITTTDEIIFYDTDILSIEELELFSKMEQDFKRASLASREERVLALPNVNHEKDLFIKTMDWSDPRPEWGLAGNMGVFAGPRDSCRHMELNNRLFLHSYDSTIDNENADILTRIFNGPLVVGEWINLEHYFSTVDNAIYGAGSKVYHNVVAKIGVYNGNYSDLKIGLPTQSVLLEGEAYHEPVRLLTYMEAPLDTVAKAVENSIAKPFILNEWIRPIIIDKAAKKVYSYEFGEFIVIKEL
ncbi:putative inorganic carbon transporter subunit DabA [Sulfurovum sp.]|uniref:putative inorganic carbon transporter subunit DabA n=1 Tax=Sulfurovum sp. TaxID=1969726 RepID=UPI002867DE1B|nr:putative inorganic carbon transporter subunit DabA [Sulfurovum sp.]